MSVVPFPRSIVALSLCLWISGCDAAPSSSGPKSPPAPAPAPATPAVLDVHAAFEDAVRSAAVYEVQHVRPLRALMFDAPSGTALVSTLTGSPFAVGSTTLTEDAWVTAVPEVKALCQQYAPATLVMDLRQLLGLHPDTAFTHFVEMQVKPADIFRPAANPDPTTTSPCNPTDPPPPALCGELFPTTASDSHRLWIADWIFDAYELSADPAVATGYPWTRLGYTYNWKPGADRYGASEFVVRSGATVEITAVTPFAEYCAAK